MANKLLYCYTVKSATLSLAPPAPPPTERGGAQVTSITRADYHMAQFLKDFASFQLQTCFAPAKS